MKNTLNLEQEFSSLLFEDKEQEAISRPLLWRQYRRTPTGNKINCRGCNPTDLGYVEGQPSCPYCSGLGYLWDEELIKGYMYKANDNKDRYNLKMTDVVGKSDTTSYVLVTPFDIFPKLEDTISILELGTNGLLTVPLIASETVAVVYSRQYHTGRTGRYCISQLGG